MRSKDPAKMSRIIEIIEHFKIKDGIDPSLAEIASVAGLSKTRTHAYIHEMAEKGLIEYREGRFDTVRTRMVADSSVAAPVVGTVKCGEPALSEEDILEYVRLPVSIFGDGDYYLLKASGDSMTDAGIDEGDLVVIQQDCDTRPGDVVVALDSEGQNTLKRLGGTDERGRAILFYENSAKYPRRSIACEMSGVQGVARFVIKKI